MMSRVSENTARSYSQSDKISIERFHDPSFWERGKEWLPKRAFFEITVQPGLKPPRGVRRDILLTLRAGPSELYRYFPFNSFLYVEDRLVEIAEFAEGFEEQTIVLSLPLGRRTRVTIITELSGVPSERNLGNDERDLALMLAGIRLGRISQSAEEGPAAASDLERFSPHYVPLVGELAKPVFVIGSYRSGTSILTWAIGQHPNIWPIEETGWLSLFGAGALAGYRNANSAVRSFFRVYDISADEYLIQTGQAVDDFIRKASRRRAQQVDLARLSEKDAEFNKNLQLVRSAFNPKRRWVDGTPEHSAYVHLLHAMFPASKFICVVRHPFDVVASMIHFERVGAKSMEAEKAAEFWTSMTTSSLLAARALGPQNVKIVLYNDLLENASGALSSIFSFLDEPRYARAADSFGARINSSELDAKERQNVRVQIESDPKIAEPLLNLYDRAKVAAAFPPDREAGAIAEIEAIQNDLIERMIGLIS